MDRPSFAALALLLAAPLPATAQGFTPEQIAEIRTLVRDELRAEVEAEVRADVRAEVEAEVRAEKQRASAHAIPDAENMPVRDPSHGGMPVALASEILLASAAAAPMEHSGTAARSGFELNVGTDAQRASLRLGRERSLRLEQGVAVFDTIALTVSAPLSKPDTGLTNLATLDGFTRSSELALTYSRWNVGGIQNPSRMSPERMAQRNEICALAGIKDGEPCDLSAVEAGLIKVGQEHYYPAYRALFWDVANTTRWTYGSTFRVGHEVYDYFGPALTKTSDTQVPWGLKTFLGFMPRGTDAFIALGAEWQRSYQAAPQQTACPNSASAILNCVTGSLAAPRSRTKHLLTAEARGEFAGLGMALKITHDLKNDESGIDLPIYLFRNDGGQFSGGVRAGWTSTDDFSFGVFVGTPLTIIR
jgi:hypothetical protein